MIHTITVGHAEVVCLGIAEVERTNVQMGEIFPDVPQRELSAAIHAAYGGDARWSFNAALIRAAGKEILVDTGFGFAGGGPGESMKSLLELAGTDPGDIDTVVITHGHGDHVGGMLDGETPAFPAAELAVSEAEYRHWESADPASPQRRGFAAYRDSRRFIRPGDPVVRDDSGETVSVIDARGHTPGHIGLELVSGGNRIWILVDTAHSLIQLVHPEWSPRYDVDPVTSRATRRSLFGQAAEAGIPVLMYHFPFPGVGIITSTADGFAFQPL